MLATMLAIVFLSPAQQDPAIAVAARLTRLADPVAYVDTEAREERMLFHWDKSAALRVGDGMRQGVAGMSELFFPDDQSFLRAYGQTTLYVIQADAEKHVVRCDDLGRLAMEVKGTPFRLELPGGTALETKDSWFRVRIDDLGRRLVIRNAGAGALQLTGPLVPIDNASIAAGHEVQIPLPTGPLDPTAPMATTDEAAPGTPEDAATASAPDAESKRPVVETVDVWQRSTIRFGPGVRATKKDADLELEGSGVARVGGARLVLRDGSRLTLWRPEP